MAGLVLVFGLSDAAAAAGGFSERYAEIPPSFDPPEPSKPSVPKISTTMSINTAVTPLQIAQSMFVDPALVTGASYVATPPMGTPNAVGDSSPSLAGFPTSGSTYGILTSGNADLADDANCCTNSGADDGGPNVRGNTDYDVTILRIDFDVPQANCVTVGKFRFLSEEFPEYVGSSFNDAFIAELDVSTWTTSGSTITAPNNFAFDPSGNPISINAAGSTSMSASEAAGTTYDGATPILQASTAITPGAHTLYFSIFDQGDRIYDSAVFIDGIDFATLPPEECEEGAEPSPVCSDGIDNDGDGFTDYPDDPGCLSPDDTDETNPPPPPECSDGVDNDGDGYTDYPEDPGCNSPNDPDEWNPPPECSDGIDNDGDGYVDWPDDVGCDGPDDDDEWNPPCRMTGEAYLVNATVYPPPVGVTTVWSERTGPVDTTSSGTYGPTALATIAGPVVYGDVWGSAIETEAAPECRSRSRASAAHLDGGPNLPAALLPLKVRAVESWSTSSCVNGTAGDVTIGYLEVGGNVIVDTTGTPAPNTVIVSGPVTVILNEQTYSSFPWGSKFEVNAVRVIVSGVADVKIVGAISDIHDCAKQPPPPPPPPECEGQGGDFVVNLDGIAGGIATGAVCPCPPPSVGAPPVCVLPQCPPPSTGTWPDCQVETCPPPSVGVPPLCFTVQPQCPPPTTGVWPDCQVQVCQLPSVGVYPNCVTPVCPPPTTGVWPNCQVPGCPPPSVGVPPVCVTGQCPPPSSGTWPNCHVTLCQPPKVGVYPNCFTVQCPPPSTGTFPNCVIEAPDRCPPGTVGVPPRCFVITGQCPPGTSGTFPNCRVDPIAQPTCPPGTSGQFPNCTVNITVSPCQIHPIFCFVVVPCDMDSILACLTQDADEPAWHAYAYRTVRV